jgi:hypothetical protein
MDFNLKLSKQVVPGDFSIKAIIFQYLVIKSLLETYTLGLCNPVISDVRTVATGLMWLLVINFVAILYLLNLKCSLLLESLDHFIYNVHLFLLS